MSNFCKGAAGPSYEVELDAVVRRSSMPFQGKTKTQNLLCKTYNWHSPIARLEIKQPKVNLNVSNKTNEKKRQIEVVADAQAQFEHHMKGYNAKMKGLLTKIGALQNETRHVSGEISKRTYLQILEAEKKREKEAELLKLSPHHARHTKCFLEKAERDPVDERIVEVLSKLTRSAKKIKDDSYDATYASRDSRIIRDTVGQLQTKKTPVQQKNDEELVNSISPASGDELVPVSDSTHIKCPESGDPSIRKYFPVKMKDLENKIDDQLNSLSSLPQEEIKKLEDKIEDQRHCLSSSYYEYEQKQNELNCVEHELEDVEAAKFYLQKNINKCQKVIKKDRDYIQLRASDDHALYCHLVTLEMIGVNTRKQVTALRDVEQRICQGNLTRPDVYALNRHKHQVLKKLRDFEISFNVAKKLIREEEKTLLRHNDLEEQIKILMKKLPDAEADIRNLQSQIQDKKTQAAQNLNELCDLSKQSVHAEKISKSSKETIEHLQKTICNKERENKLLERQLLEAREKVDCEIKEKKERAKMRQRKKLFDPELKELRKQVEQEQMRLDAVERKLKKAENTVGERDKMLDRENMRLSKWKKRCVELSVQQMKAEFERDHFPNAIKQEKMVSIDKIAKKNVLEGLKKQIAKLKEENSSLKFEFKHHRKLAASAKEKCLVAQDELLCLLDNVREQKAIQNKLHQELLHAQYQTDAACSTCQKVVAISNQLDADPQLEQLSDLIEVRLSELQPLPELLKCDLWTQNTELRLHNTLEKLKTYDQRSSEQSQLVAKLLTKSNCNEKLISSLKSQLSAKNAQHDKLQNQICDLYHHLEDRSINAQNSLCDAAKFQEKMHQLQCELDETSRQRNIVRFQLDHVNDSKKRLEEMGTDAANPQSLFDFTHISELENQLHLLQNDVIAASRSKQQSERHCQQELQDVIDKLEQTQASNKSLKEYVSAFRLTFTDGNK